MANLAMQRLAKADAAMRGTASQAVGEPNLRELMDDPITRHVMASDGIERGHLVDLVRETRAKLARRRD